MRREAFYVPYTGCVLREADALYASKGGGFGEAVGIKKAPMSRVMTTKPIPMRAVVNRGFKVLHIRY